MSRSRPRVHWIWILIGIALLVALAIFLILIVVAIWKLFPVEGVALPTGAKTPVAKSTARVTVSDLRPVANSATVRRVTVAEVRDEGLPASLRRKLDAKGEVLLLVYAEVKAGFDLSRLSEADLRIDGNSVRLVLPAPRILSITLDPKRTHAVYQSGSLLVRTSLERSQDLTKAGNEAVRKEAIAAGILEQASAHGRLYFENHLRQLGFTDVQVSVR